MSCPIRIHPLRKPKNHRLPVPRYTLALPGGVSHIYTAYVGVQQNSSSAASEEGKRRVCLEIDSWLRSQCGPAAWEAFALIEGREAATTSTSTSTTVWVGYWSDAGRYGEAMGSLGLRDMYARLAGEGRVGLGLWCEGFATRVSRLETNYSGLDYLPGLGRVPGSSAAEHDLATYWGAARDRIPDSARDLFARPAGGVDWPAGEPRGLGQYLTGTNHDNLVHIRSGQWWEECDDKETAAYEEKLEPALRKGLRYLNEHAKETGAMGVRYLRNTDVSEPMMDYGRQETCGAGFFANLEDLEHWAKTHSSHLSIWRGALAHYKAFADDRRFRTWHEVSVIQEGDARFEYVNCTPGTGVMGAARLEEEKLVS